jgi:hypothetical protein
MLTSMTTREITVVPLRMFCISSVCACLYPLGARLNRRRDGTDAL